MDREFLSKLFLANKGALISYLRRLGADFHTAEDLTHEVFLRLYEKSQKGLETVESIPPLMMGIGRNLFLRHLRKAGQVHLGFSGAEIPALVQGKRRELILVFNSILSGDGDELSDREKEVLYLRFSDGRKLKEIAGIVKIDEKTVRTSLEKGVKVIRKVFQKEGWTWEDWE
ncbi:RNA polymerase sigma factor [Leptospira ilyithenensis]|uniref:Sigma-70 family RNA polymerase sigma factor n=1 Tax=Leptospira ilyithenensis TaxID=2484901 RepID=A0A4R9LJP9_9LEPT|nr:sigma-70 family RNA polymerase sigma factor [Leptospira ilyithenensis]TGN07063.1 sigma-70 family RNA polymerase sigma factor [Leptospira ilyithenensis]